MKVLLIQPNIITFGGVTSPPLALLLIGTYIKSKGYEVKIIDRNIDFFSYKKINEYKPDVVGITTMTGGMLFDAIEVSKKIKKKWGDDVKVVWGGIHTSLLPEQSLKNDYVDYITIGEGEVSFHQLLETLKNNTPLEGIKGIGYKKNGQVVLNEDREFIKDLDELPMLDYNLINFKEYCRTEITFVTSRGCPFSCAFCYNQRYNQRRWRSWSAERTLLEIERATKLTKNKRLKFYDDNFGANKKRLLKILNGLDRDYSIWMELRVDALDLEILDELSRFKKIWLFVGVESGSERMLKRMSKHLTLNIIKEKFKLIKNYKNIEVTGSIVIGCPGESKEEIQQSVSLLKELNPTRHSVCIYIPFPGSDFYEESINRGLFDVPDTTEEWAEVISNTVTAKNIKYINREVLKDVKKLYRKGYIRTIWNFIIRGQFFKFYHKLLDYKPFIIKFSNKFDTIFK
jgi:radical SAM superfamily enzyme YgiQ (UPF0313 family)